VFDGVAGELKDDTLQKRAQTREAARERHQQAKAAAEQGHDGAKTPEELQRMARRGSHVGAREIEAVYRLLDTFGVTGAISSGESDPLMAAYVLDHTAVAAVSADGDMLAYGVPQLITELDTSGRTCTRVRLATVLERLQLTQAEFLDLCITLGTDYNREP
jgi:flap endonuclease-1